MQKNSTLIANFALIDTQRALKIQLGSNEVHEEDITVKNACKL